MLRPRRRLLAIVLGLTLAALLILRLADTPHDAATPPSLATEEATTATTTVLQPQPLTAQNSPCNVSYEPTQLRIRHPKNKNAHLLHTEPGLYVSFSPDRAFPMPLHGAVFDTSSEVFLFFMGPKGAFRNAAGRFQMDDSEHRKASQARHFLDYVGPEALDQELAVGFNIGWLSASLTTPLLGCHTLTASVISPAGGNYSGSAQFAVVSRIARVRLSCSIRDYSISHQRVLALHVL